MTLDSIQKTAIRLGIEDIKIVYDAAEGWVCTMRTAYGQIYTGASTKYLEESVKDALLQIDVAHSTRQQHIL